MSEKNKSDPLSMMEKALQNVGPTVEVKSRRVGGSNYQVPIEVNPRRKLSLAMRWILDAAQNRNEKSMKNKLASELLDACEGKGSAVKKREDVHKWQRLIKLLLIIGGNNGKEDSVRKLSKYRDHGPY